jgi:hypothetical protein
MQVDENTAVILRAEGFETVNSRWAKLEMSDKNIGKVKKSA